MTERQKPLEITWIRHGIATDPLPGQPDDQRSLTRKGRARVSQVARSLKKQRWHWQVILTSPLLRAQQTAEILLDHHLADHTEMFLPLAPGGAFAEVTLWCQQHPDVRSLALVGHQPDLSTWLVTALWGSVLETVPEAANRIPLKKSGIAQVQFPQGTADPGQGVLITLLPPRLLRVAKITASK